MAESAEEGSSCIYKQNVRTTIKLGHAGEGRIIMLLVGCPNRIRRDQPYKTQLVFEEPSIRECVLFTSYEMNDDHHRDHHRISNNRRIDL